MLDHNGQNLYPFSDRNGAKTLPFGAGTYLYGLFKGESPPGKVYGLSLHKKYLYAYIRWLGFLRVVCWYGGAALKVIILPLRLSEGVVCCTPTIFTFREEGEIAPKSREEGDLPSCTSPLYCCF